MARPPHSPRVRYSALLMRGIPLALATPIWLFADTPRESNVGWRRHSYANPPTWETYEMPTQAGVLRCLAPAYDFGEAWPNEIVHHEFLVENTGDEPIWVQPVMACFCLPPSRFLLIHPHSSRAIPCVLRPSGLSGRVVKSWSISVVQPPMRPVCDECGVDLDHHAHAAEWYLCQRQPESRPAK